MAANTIYGPRLSREAGRSGNPNRDTLQGPYSPRRSAQAVGHSDPFKVSHSGHLKTIESLWKIWALSSNRIRPPLQAQSVVPNKAWFTSGDSAGGGRATPCRAGSACVDPQEQRAWEMPGSAWFPGEGPVLAGGRPVLVLMTVSSLTSSSRSRIASMRRGPALPHSGRYVC